MLQVILVGALKENRSGIIQIRKISYKEGICAGNSHFGFNNDIFEKKVNASRNLYNIQSILEREIVNSMCHIYQ